MNTKLNLFRAILTTVLAASTQIRAQSWSLAGDWSPPANPNGAWSYGSVNNAGGDFAPLPWTGSDYGVAAVGNVFIYQNTAAIPLFGIDPGQISLECDWGNADVRWTAPVSGFYDVSALIGGSTANEGPGYGNNFAQYAVLNINGVSQADTSFTDNVKNWTITDVYLTAGENIDSFVVNPGYADGGNTEAQITINAIAGAPDVSPCLLLLSGSCLALGGLRRKLRLS